MADLIIADPERWIFDEINYTLIRSLWGFLRDGFHAMRVMARVPAPVRRDRRSGHTIVTVHSFNVVLCSPGLFSAVLGVEYVDAVFGANTENVDREIRYSFQFTERAAGVSDFAVQGRVCVFYMRSDRTFRWDRDVELPMVAIAANTILSRLAPVLVRVGVPSRVFGGNRGFDGTTSIILDQYAELLLNDDVPRALRRILDNGGWYPPMRLSLRE